MSSRSYLFRGTGKRQRVFNDMKCQQTCQIQNEIGTWIHGERSHSWSDWCGVHEDMWTVNRKSVKHSGISVHNTYFKSSKTNIC